VGQKGYDFVMKMILNIEMPWTKLRNKKKPNWIDNIHKHQKNARYML